MISEKAVNYKLFRIGNEKGLRGLGIFTAKKKLDKVIDTSRIRDRIIAFKVFAQGIINSVISVKVPQFGSDRKKDIFYDSLSNIIRKVKEEENCRFFNGYSGSNAEDYVEQHGGYGYGADNKKGKGFRSFVQL